MATIKECPVFYSFFYIKKEIKFSEYFQKTCKKPLFKQNSNLIKVNFGLFFHGWNFAQIIGLLFLEKKFAQHHKKSPKWQNFAQSGHPADWTTINIYNRLLTKYTILSLIFGIHVAIILLFIIVTKYYICLN